MIRDVIPFADAWRTLRSENAASRAMASFVQFIERQLGSDMVYDAARFPYMRPDLAAEFELAEKLRSNGVIRSYAPRYNFSDEPPMYEWLASYRDGIESTAGGASVHNDQTALTATLAEAVERYIWFEETDYFHDTRHERPSDIMQIHDAIRPEAFSSFPSNVRDSHPELQLLDTPYTWIRGVRLPQETSVYIPAHIVSGSLRARQSGEPIIRYPITTGLATWPTREGAILRGILETVERDAYMITWLNHLSSAKFDVDTLCEQNAALAKLVARCRRYRLEPHVVRLVTDAPTYAVCVVLEDMTGNAPRFAHGLKAGPSAAVAAEGAIFEALRARRGARGFLAAKKPDDAPIAMKDVGHYKRILYWAEDDRFKRLAFLHAGPLQKHHEPWENDTEAEHLQRLLRWITDRGYTCASVSFTHSRANITPWHIEFVVIPELLPMHFKEDEPYTGGARLTEVPRSLGFVPREEPYLDDPHPFA